MAIRSAALLAANRSHVLGALATFANKAPDQWCPVGHPAHAGSLPSWGGMATVTPAHASEAIAASAPNHCIDGWSYASRALSALLAGDGHAARHLAYYAQLRAGLSMLANLGIGIFNRTNFVIDAAGAIVRLDDPPANKPRGGGLGTHEIVWAALSQWAANAQTSRTFLELVKIRGVSLKECLDAIWPGMPAAGAATALIEAWGIDLKRGNDEHKYRNSSSYSPQAMNPLDQTVPAGLKFIEGFWTLFEPTGGANFDKLDRYLLRSLLLRQHRTIHNNQSYGQGQIATRYNELPAAIRSLASREFLTNRQDPHNPDLIQRANRSASPAQAVDMISRAFLLLRAATAFTHTSFVEAGISLSAGALRPWIDPWAASRGFWPPSTPLAEPVDLWLDVELALIDFSADLTANPASLNDWTSRGARGIPTIYEAERIGVWSLSA